ncbi:MAG: hypothetical protein QXO22_06435 [Thermosphaera sp.]
MSEEWFEDSYDVYLDIWEIESDEREEQTRRELCTFYKRYKDYPLYDLLEEELSAYPLSELCEDEGGDRMKLMVKQTIKDDIKYLCWETVVNIEQILNEYVKKSSLKDQILNCIKEVIDFNCDEIVKYVFNILKDFEEGRI